MNAHSLDYLSRSIDAALEALIVPAAVLLSAAFVVVAGSEIRARWRDRRPQPIAMPAVARRGSRARGAEA